MYHLPIKKNNQVIEVKKFNTRQEIDEFFNEHQECKKVMVNGKFETLLKKKKTYWTWLFVVQG